VDRTRKFKTIIKVSDGNGNFTQTASNVDEIHKDCIGNVNAGDPVSDADDEVVLEGCTGEGEVCTEAARLETQGSYYGCAVSSRIPTRSGNKFIGDAVFACTAPVAKRQLIAYLCDDVSHLNDLCEGLTSRYLNGTGNWYAFPACTTMRDSHESTLLQKFQGTYTRGLIDPRRQGSSNPPPRDTKSPRARYSSDGHLLECSG